MVREQAVEQAVVVLGRKNAFHVFPPLPEQTDRGEKTDGFLAPDCHQTKCQQFPHVNHEQGTAWKELGYHERETGSPREGSALLR